MSLLPRLSKGITLDARQGDACSIDIDLIYKHMVRGLSPNVVQMVSDDIALTQSPLNPSTGFFYQRPYKCAPFKKWSYLGCISFHANN